MQPLLERGKSINHSEMKTKQIFLSIVGIVTVFLTAMFVNDMFTGLGVGVAFAAFITNGSEYNGKENMEINLRPRFFGTKPSQMGIRVIDARGTGSVKLTFFGKIQKILMPYVTGFQGGSLAPKYQKKLELEEFKAETAYSKQDYKDIILEQITNRGGVYQNDIEGTNVIDAEREVFFQAVESDVFAQFWLGDKTKTHIRDGEYPSGTAYSAGDADKYYNTINGLLKAIMTDVYQVYVSHQVRISGWDTSTYPILYIAGGGAGTAYAYASAADRTAGVAGTRLFSIPETAVSYPSQVAVTELNDSGFGGYVVLEAAATSVSFELNYNEEDYIKKLTLPTLTTDTAETYMNRLLRLATPELIALKKSGDLRFYVTDTILQNYEDTLKSGTTESARTANIDGVSRYTCDGVPLIPMNVDALIERDFAADFPRNWIILSTPQNFCLVINGSSDFSETRFWFNPDENENRQRTQFEFGANYILPELVATAYA